MKYYNEKTSSITDFLNRKQVFDRSAEVNYNYSTIDKTEFTQVEFESKLRTENEIFEKHQINKTETRMEVEVETESGKVNIITSS